MSINDLMAKRDGIDRAYKQDAEVERLCAEVERLRAALNRLRDLISEGHSTLPAGVILNALSDARLR